MSAALTDPSLGIWPVPCLVNVHVLHANPQGATWHVTLTHAQTTVTLHDVPVARVAVGERYTIPSLVSALVATEQASLMFPYSALEIDLLTADPLQITCRIMLTHLDTRQSLYTFPIETITVGHIYRHGHLWAHMVQPLTLEGGTP